MHTDLSTCLAQGSYYDGCITLNTLIDSSGSHKTQRHKGQQQSIDILAGHIAVYHQHRQQKAHNVLEDSSRTSQAGAALAVAHVGLDRANEQRVLSRACAGAAVPLLQRAQLLPVAGHCARAVRLDVGDG